MRSLSRPGYLAIYGGLLCYLAVLQSLLRSYGLRL